MLIRNWSELVARGAPVQLVWGDTAASITITAVGIVIGHNWVVLVTTAHILSHWKFQLNYWS